MPITLDQVSSFVLVLNGNPFGAVMLLSLIATLLWFARRNSGRSKPPPTDTKPPINKKRPQRPRDKD